MRRWSIALLVLSATACGRASVSETKSLIGLEAGQDAELRAADAPIFLALSDWFQRFEIAVDAGTETPGYRTDAASLRQKLPAAHLAWLRRYFADQTTRIDEILRQLDANDLPEVRRLLELETREMSDIALVMIHPRYRPVTDDLLARFMAASRESSAFVDHFAGTGFLDRLLRYSDVPTLVSDIERQRAHFLDGMLNRYTADPTAITHFRQQLAANRRSAAAATVTLDGGAFRLNGVGDALSAADSNDVSVNGVLAVLASFISAGDQNAPPAAQAPSEAAANEESDEETDEAADLAADVSSDELPDGDAPGLESDSSSDANKGIIVPESRSLASVYADSTPQMSLNDEEATPSVDRSAEAFVSSRALAALDPKNDAELLLTSAPDLEPVSAPLVDCNAFGLNGQQLIQCHRHAGFANLQLDAVDRPSRGWHLSDAQGAADLGILSKKVLSGAAEDGTGGHIFNQGQLGSCSLQAAVGAAAIQLMARNVAPESVLPMDGNAINQAFTSIQQSTPSLEAAIDTVRVLVGDSFEVQAQQVDWDGMHSCIAAGKPVVLGVSIDLPVWTADGGGLEFGDLFPQTQSASSGMRRLTCANTQTGHAIVGVGATADGDIIIKNSWGTPFNGRGQGTGVLDRASCDALGMYYCLDIQSR